MSLTEKECSELLPWYLNGTLTTDEKLAVETRLQKSTGLQQELHRLTLLRDSLPKQEIEFPAATLGWRRLQKQIRSEQHLPKQRHWGSAIAIAAMLIIAVQVGLFSLMKPNAPSSDVRLLGGQSMEVAARQHVVQLQIASNASWQEVMQLVTTLHGDMVQGPSAIGLVRIRFSLENITFDGQQVTDVETVVNWLRAQTIVQHAAVEK